jgi:hypothetical protein
MNMSDDDLIHIVLFLVLAAKSERISPDQLRSALEGLNPIKEVDPNKKDELRKETLKIVLPDLAGDGLKQKAEKIEQELVTLVELAKGSKIAALQEASTADISRILSTVRNRHEQVSAVLAFASSGDAYIQGLRQQHELATRKERLESDRWWSGFWYYVFAVAGILILLAGLGYLLYCSRYDEGGFAFARHNFVILWILLGLGALAVLPMLGSRERGIREQIEAIEFEDDLLRFAPNARENRAEKLLRIQEVHLRRFYSLNLTQNWWAFGAGLFCILLGTSIIGFTLYLLSHAPPVDQADPTGKDGKTIIGVLGAVSGILSSFVGAIFLSMFRSISGTLERFHTRLSIFFWPTYCSRALTTTQRGAQLLPISRGGSGPSRRHHLQLRAKADRRLSQRRSSWWKRGLGEAGGEPRETFNARPRDTLSGRQASVACERQPSTN